MLVHHTIMPETLHISDSWNGRAVSILIHLHEREPSPTEDIVAKMHPGLLEHGLAYFLYLEAFRVNKDGTPNKIRKRYRQDTHCDCRINPWEREALIHRLRVMIAAGHNNTAEKHLGILADMAADWLEERGAFPALT